MGRKPKHRRDRFGAWLHFLRKDRGLSQEEVANQTGVARSTLMSWERSGNLPGRQEIVKLAKLYRISIPKLLRGG